MDLYQILSWKAAPKKVPLNDLLDHWDYEYLDGRAWEYYYNMLDSDLQIEFGDLIDPFFDKVDRHGKYGLDEAYNMMDRKTQEELMSVISEFEEKHGITNE